MTDIDFDAALAAKVGEGTTATIEEEPEAVVEAEAPQETPEERPRDEKGRFTSERPEWLPENFKSVEDYVKSLESKTELFDRQANELGELRRMVDDLNKPSATDQYGSIREALEENPESVATWALQNQNEQLFDAALTAWQQKAIDEGDAVSLRKANKLEREVDLHRLRYELTEQVLPPIQEVRQDAQRRALSLAQRDLSQRYPDFDQVMESAASDASLTEGLSSDLVRQLQESDPKAALELIYATASVRMKVGQQAVEQQDREADLQRKREAAVATSSSSPAERAKDPKEALREFFLTPDAHDVRHGLQS